MAGLMERGHTKLRRGAVAPVTAGANREGATD